MTRRALIVWLLVCASGYSAELVPFFNDATYQRDEPTDPPWWVMNTGQPSNLYHNGEWVSRETGTNDLDLTAAWVIQGNGCKVGIITLATDMPRMVSLVQTVSPYSEVFQNPTPRWDVPYFAQGISNCVNAGCRVVCFDMGWASPDEGLSNACLSAAASNALIVYAVPDREGDLDSWLVDYPYAWRMGHVLPVTSGDRNGGHFSPSATGTNCLQAPGRNIVGGVPVTYGSGTSWACAIAAGAAALVAGRYPEQAPAAWVAALQASGQVLRPAEALAAPVPRLQGILQVEGLAGWRYTLQASPDLVNWQDAQGVVDWSGVRFYRLRL